MYTFHIDIAGGTKAVSVLHALSADLTQRQFNAGVSPAVETLTVEHLHNLGNTRHRKGVGFNFWHQVAESVSHSDLSDGVELKVSQAGAAQRYFGGTIKAVNPTHFRDGREIPLLWIPVSPASEGKSARAFKGLVPIYSTLTSKGVAIQHEKGKKLKDEPVLFALVPEVTQDADPSVLPTDDEYAAAIATAVDELLATYAPGGSAP